MRWVRYEADNTVSYGILEGDQVQEVTGSPFDAYTRTSKRRPLDAVKLLIPVVPPTFYAAGLNYVDHLRVADPVLGHFALVFDDLLEVLSLHEAEGQIA